MAIDGAALRVTLRNWSSGVVVVTARHQALNYGMTVSSFASVSLEPPLILVCLHKETQTARAALESRAFAVSILAEDQVDLSNRFAGYEPAFHKEVDRFAGLELDHLQTGAPFLTSAVAYLDCTLWQVYEGGTHHIIIGEVVATATFDGEKKPLIYYNRSYGRVIKSDDGG